MARAGLMRQRAAFYTRTSSADTYGNTVSGWTLQFTVWAQLQPGGSREAIEAGRLEGSTAAVLRVRGSSDTETVNTGWKVAVGGVEYQIRGVSNPDQKGHVLEMVVERGVAV